MSIMRKPGCARPSLLLTSRPPRDPDGDVANLMDDESSPGKRPKQTHNRSLGIADTGIPYLGTASAIRIVGVEAISHKADDHVGDDASDEPADDFALRHLLSPSSIMCCSNQA